MVRIRVVYIVGSGRSGSTVLDTVLGDSTNVESVGELVNAPRAFAVVDEHCACGERVGDCSFWRTIHQEWVNVSEFDDLHELDRLQRRYELKKRWPYLFISRLLKTKRYRRYLEGEQVMCQAIAHVSGKQVIVDSSKSPIRAFALSKMPEIDFRALHHVCFAKDPCGFVMKTSWMIIPRYA